MTGGKHITANECYNIQRKRAKGKTIKTIANTLHLNKNTVRNHANGNCPHDRINVRLDSPEVVIEPDETAKRIREWLRDHPELKKSQYETEDERSLGGHCYVASEAYYHARGGKDSGLGIYCLSWDDGGTHWYLRDGDTFVDLTVENPDGVPYYEGNKRGFLTSGPSKRARKVLDALNIKVSV